MPHFTETLDQLLYIIWIFKYWIGLATRVVSVPFCFLMKYDFFVYSDEIDVFKNKFFCKKKDLFLVQNLIFELFASVEQSSFIALYQKMFLFQYFFMFQNVTKSAFLQVSMDKAICAFDWSFGHFQAMTKWDFVTIRAQRWLYQGQ